MKCGEGTNCQIRESNREDSYMYVCMKTEQTKQETEDMNWKERAFYCVLFMNLCMYVYEGDIREGCL